MVIGGRITRSALVSGSANPPTRLIDSSVPARLRSVEDSAHHAAIPVSEDGEPPALHDHGSDGVTIFLGERGDRIWHLVVDGGGTRTGELSAKSREDILFLAGECAGLLFLGDFAGKVP